MTPRHLRYLMLECCLGSAVVNAVINGAIGWATTRALPSLPLWRIPGVVADLAGTAFGVTFGTCLGMAFQIRRDMKAGKIAPVPVSPGFVAVLARFPEGTFKRCLGLGLLSVPLFALPVVGGLVALGIGALERVPFVILKATFAALEAACVTPFLALAALEDVRRSAPIERAPDPVPQG
jgi:hypothetical protein